MKVRHTEEILNSTNWVDGNGVITPISEMDKDHLHNILNFIFRKRDRYWLNCQRVTVVEAYENGDEFFQKVIRKSTLWEGIIFQLEKPESNFNFSWEMGGRFDEAK